MNYKTGKINNLTNELLKKRCKLYVNQYNYWEKEFKRGNIKDNSKSEKIAK